MKSHEYPTAEDNRPVTGSCLDQIPVEEVDWREYFAELDEEKRLGHPLALDESIQFGYRASSLTPEERDHHLQYSQLGPNFGISSLSKHTLSLTSVGSTQLSSPL